MKSAKKKFLLDRLVYKAIFFSQKKKIPMSDKLTRIGKNEIYLTLAIVNSDKCKPKKCRQECKKGCPVVRMGTMVFTYKRQTLY